MEDDFDLKAALKEVLGRGLNAPAPRASLKSYQALSPEDRATFLTRGGIITEGGDQWEGGDPKLGGPRDGKIKRSDFDKMDAAGRHRLMRGGTMLVDD